MVWNQFGDFIDLDPDLHSSNFVDPIRIQSVRIQITAFCSENHRIRTLSTASDYLMLKRLSLTTSLLCGGDLAQGLNLVPDLDPSENHLIFGLAFNYLTRWELVWRPRWVSAAGRRQPRAVTPWTGRWDSVGWDTTVSAAATPSITLFFYFFLCIVYTVNAVKLRLGQGRKKTGFFKRKPNPPRFLGFSVFVFFGYFISFWIFSEFFWIFDFKFFSLFILSI